MRDDVRAILIALNSANDMVSNSLLAIRNSQSKYVN